MSWKAINTCITSVWKKIHPPPHPTFIINSDCHDLGIFHSTVNKIIIFGIAQVFIWENYLTLNRLYKLVGGGVSGSAQ